MDVSLFAISEIADLVWIVKQFGPLVLMVGFVLWRDQKREDRLAKRINMLEDEQRKVILPLVKECAAVIARNTTVMERLESALAGPPSERGR